MRRARRSVVLLVAALALPATGARAAPAPGGGGLCPVLELVPPLACRAAASSAQAPEQAPADESDGVRRTPTTVRYDPGRITVTFERGVTRRRVDAVFAQAGVTPEQAIPEIRAYMVAVESSRLDSALESLRSSRDVASAGQEVLADALDATPNDADWPQQ